MKIEAHANPRSNHKSRDARRHGRGGVGWRRRRVEMLWWRVRRQLEGL